MSLSRSPSAILATSGIACAAWMSSACADKPLRSLISTAGDAASEDSSSANDSDSSVLPDQCSGICNATAPSDPTTTPEGGIGDITMYSTLPSNGGACNYGATDIAYYAAISVNDQPGDALGAWQDGRICGECAMVTALTSQGPKNVVARIMDKCPDGYCGIDLGGDAPAAIMVDGFGRYLGRWEFVSCVGHAEVFDGPTVLSVSSSANPYWSVVQVRNPPSAVTSMSWQDTTDTSQTGEFTYSGEAFENTYQVPLAVLGSNATFSVTVSYRDDAPATVTLNAQDLAAPGASYPLQ